MTGDFIIVLLIVLGTVAFALLLHRRTASKLKRHRVWGRALTAAELEQHRKSIRIPVSCSVSINSDLTATTREVGPGGMSVYTDAPLAVSQPIHVNFVLPPDRPISIAGVVWWRRHNMVGIRFDVYDRQLLAIRSWVEEQADVLLARAVEASQGA